MPNPFMIASGLLSVVGTLQAGRAEARRQAAIVSQREQNKKVEQLRALQEHNARLDSFDRFVSTTNAVAAINNRSQSDRSIAALKRAGRDKSMQQIDRARTQSLFTQSRMQFAADDARFASQLARQRAITSAASSIATMGYRMQQVTPTSP